MAVVLRIPALLSLLVLGAHFFRAGSLALVALCLAAIGVIFVPRRWAMRVVQIFLLLGTLEWLRSTYVLIGERAESGEPWTRLAVILGSVAACTFVSALLFELRAVRSRY